MSRVFPVSWDDYLSAESIRLVFNTPDKKEKRIVHFREMFAFHVFSLRLVTKL